MGSGIYAIRLIATKPLNVAAAHSVSSTTTLTAQMIHVSSSTDGLGNTSTTYYDDMGRGTTTAPDGSSTQTLYGVSGNPVPGHTVPGQTISGYQKTDIDQLGNATDSFYDLAGRLTDVYEPAVSEPYAATVLDDDPVLYWRLGESSGTNAYDASGNGNTGTYLGTATLGQSGALTGDSNTAVGFNGGVVSSSHPAGISGVQFSSQQTWAAGSTPYGVASGDFNGDGIPDLVTANYSSGAVSVLLGNGDGSFQSQTTFAAGTTPDWVSAADVNSDGKLDLLVAQRNANTISVLLGNGNGTFAAPTSFAVGTMPISLATADLNGDGKADLVVSNYNYSGSGSVSVLLGNGNGTFGAQTTFATNLRPGEVKLADVNGDGKSDILVASRYYSGAACVLLGNGNGSFQPQLTFATGLRSVSIATADFNGDGKLDLAVANITSGNVSVLLGNGNGTFGAQTTFAAGSGPSSLTVADLNGDGALDIVASNPFVSTVSVLLGNGDGTFQSRATMAAGAGASSTAIADLNGDGLPDIAVADATANTVSTLLNQTPGAARALNLSRTTVEGWVYLNANPSSDALVAGFSDAQAGYNEDLYVDSGGHVHWYVNDGGGKDVSYSTALSVDTWHQLAGTLDGTTSVLYVDGQAVGSTASGPAAVHFVNPDFQVGGDRGSRHFASINARIDDVSVYDHALSSAQLANQYSAGRGDIAGASNLARPHWSYTYDALGDELTQTDPNGNVTSWDYDAKGQKTGETLPGGQTETWSYDTFGREDQAVDFKGNTATTSYYPSTSPHAGMVQEMDYYAPGAGSPSETVIYTYDDLNRKMGIEDVIGGTTATTTYGYDESGGEVTINPTSGVTTAVSGDTDGLLTSVSDPEGTIHYVYDAVTGRLVETWTGTTHSTAVTDTRYGYDAMGHLASTTILKQDGSTPSLTTSTISYLDARGDSITPTTYWPTTLDTYDADGNVIKVAYPNGTEQDTDYSSYWVTSGAVFGTETITNKRGTTILSSYTYSYDADRRKISDLETNVEDAGEGASSSALYTWSYDAINRLTQEKYDYGNNGETMGVASDDYTTDFVYDLDGNRVTQTTDNNSDGTIDQTVTDSYNANNELVAETDGASYNTVYTYDADGSPTSVVKLTTGTTATTGYTYDVRNRMASVAIGTTTTSYSYDDDGNIVSQKTGSSAATTYLLDTHNPTGYAQRIEAWNGGGTPNQTYIIANTILGQNDGGVVSFFMTDGEQSTRQLTAYTPSNSSTNGHVTGRYDFTAFGDDIVFRVSTHAANSANTLVQFKGAPLDLITGNVIFGVREYNPNFDRFWTQDSDTFKPGDLDNANLYAYVAANPMNLSDPTGFDYTVTDTNVSSGIGITLATLGFIGWSLVHNYYSNSSATTATTTAAATAVTVSPAVTAMAAALDIPIKTATDVDTDQDPNYRYFVHGTTTSEWIGKSFVLSQARFSLDFGPGVYAYPATFRGQAAAADLAHNKKGALENLGRLGGLPVLIEFRVLESTYDGFSKVDFNDPEWAGLYSNVVNTYRTFGNGLPSVNPDIVIGPIANQDKLSGEWYQTTDTANPDQYAFKTIEAVDAIQPVALVPLLP